MPRVNVPGRTAGVAGALLAAVWLTGCPSHGPPPAVESVTIEGGDRLLAVGGSVRLSAQVSPAGAAAGLTWYSADPAVAAVTGSGVSADVVGVAAGATTVTVVSASDPAKNDSVAVEVLEPGSVLWTQQFGTDVVDQCESVAAAPDGTVVLTGPTAGALDGPHNGQRDVFVRGYGPDGQPRWGQQFGSSGNDTGYGTAVAADGSMAVAGSTSGDLATGNAGGADVFVRRYEQGGAAVWTRQFGTASPEVANAVATDSWGRSIVCGYTRGVLAGPGFGLADAFARSFGP